MGTRSSLPAGIWLVNGESVGDGLQENVFATELQRAVANQARRAAGRLRTGSESRCRCRAPRPPLAAKCLHGLHHRAEPRDGAGAQIIAVAETAGNDDGIGIAERGFLVPDAGARNGRARCAGRARRPGRSSRREIGGRRNSFCDLADVDHRMLDTPIEIQIIQSPMVIFDDRVAQKLVAGLVDLFADGFLVAGRPRFRGICRRARRRCRCSPCVRARSGRSCPAGRGRLFSA